MVGLTDCFLADSNKGGFSKIFTYMTQGKTVKDNNWAKTSISLFRTIRSLM